MTEIKLKRGDIVRRSISGARGFFYPDTAGKAILIREDCIAEKQAGWNECSNFMPCSVPSDAVSKRDRYSPTTQRMVVWVKSNG